MNQDGVGEYMISLDNIEAANPETMDRLDNSQVKGTTFSGGLLSPILSPRKQYQQRKIRHKINLVTGSVDRESPRPEGLA